MDSRNEIVTERSGQILDVSFMSDAPEIVLTHRMEGIGLSLDVAGDRMFVTDFGGSVYTAPLDGSVEALWRSRTGEGQDIHVDVRKALRRFCCFFEGKWETVNGRGPGMGAFRDNPFFDLPLFRRTRDGRHVVAFNIYPRLRARSIS